MAPTPDSAVNTLDRLLDEALLQNASDIHFENGEDYFRVRYRIDGLLRIAAKPAVHLRDALLSRIKVLARMDIAEKRLPQDGRMQYLWQNQAVDLRVSSLPTRHGEKVVVRILNFKRERPNLQTLGYEPDDRDKLIRAISQPHGLILMTGPTGSGKTSSLYSCLDLLNRDDINISTVEDPSEIDLPGANQVNVNERAGLTFASTLRAMLRQDPDVIMVGEIRDTETAEIAIQAAQTGHLVLTTLHTNDAPSTLARLRHMRIPAFNVAASVCMITAQRLVRRLCQHCKQAVNEAQTRLFLHQLSAHDKQTLSSASRAPPTIFQAMGCPACDHGYRGRVGLFQVMPISETMQQLIMRDSDVQTLAQQAAREGVRTLRQAGWLKVMHGITSIDEVMALTQHG